MHPAQKPVEAKLEEEDQCGSIGLPRDACDCESVDCEYERDCEDIIEAEALVAERDELVSLVAGPVVLAWLSTGRPPTKAKARAGLTAVLPRLGGPSS